MTAPTPTKRSVGRPRKNAKKQENPDCEVASKGYVKCVARNLYAIPKRQLHDRSMIWGLLTFVFALVYIYEVSANHPDSLTGGILLAIFATLFANDVLAFAALHYDEKHDLSFAQKHEEPPCEPERGCEGE